MKFYKHGTGICFLVLSYISCFNVLSFAFFSTQSTEGQMKWKNERYKGAI